MIARAAVKVFDKRRNIEMIIPCHRHCDAFQILNDFGYRRYFDYEEMAQGFLDDEDNFLTRAEAFQEATRCNQILPNAETEAYILYSEDVW